MSLISSDPLALLAIESGMVRPPLADAAAEGASQLDSPQRAAVIGEPVPIVFCRRDEVNGSGGVLISPPATEARFSNDPTNAVTASYHLVLSEGRIGSVQVRDVFQRSCRVGSHTQTYSRRAGTWIPGNYITPQAGYDMPECPYYCGTIGTYTGLSTGSFTVTIPNGFDLWNRQVHWFIRNGMEVERLVDGVVGSSNNFADLVLWSQINCAKLRSDQIDMTNMRAAAMFLHRNRLTCDTRITKSGNLEDFISHLAPYFLLTTTRINGKRGLRPLLPVNPDGTIKTSPVSWRAVFTEEQILPGGFEISHVPTTDRRPFCCQVIWRQQLTDDFGIIRTSEVRYEGEAVDGPYEQHDLSDVATTEDHAVKVGAYIRARRRYVGHTARLRCRAADLPNQLAAGELIRVTLQRDPSGTTAGVHDLLYQVEQIEPIGVDVTLSLTHFPVDSAGCSMVAREVASARGTGILLSSNRTGISCDLNSATDETVPPEEFTVAEPSDDQTVIKPVDSDKSGGINRYTYGYDSPPNIPPTEGINAGLYFHSTSWSGTALNVKMRIDPPGRAPLEAYGDLIATIESGRVVAVNAAGQPVSPQPAGLPSLKGTGLVAHPWLPQYYPEAAGQAMPGPEQVFEANFRFLFAQSDLPSDPGIEAYQMPISIIETQGGFAEVARLNETVAVFKKQAYERVYISIIDEDDSYEPSQRDADYAAFNASQSGNLVLIFLKPGSPGYSVGLPSNWSGFSYVVTRPGDPGGTQTNYSQLLQEFIVPGITGLVHIAVDNSGSMTRDTVAADLDAFEASLSAAGVDYEEVDMQPIENWIAPHIGVGP